MNSLRLNLTGRNRILTIATCGALLLAEACGGSSGSSSSSSTPPPPTGSNVQAIAVNGGPAGFYTNGAFTSVTVCVPSTTACQTVGGVLVDTGSSGLRLLSSALAIGLPQQKTAGGDPVVECFPFISSYVWGPVQTADIELAGEKASSVPIQVIDGSAYPTPSACADFGSPGETLSDLGANGILGVGNFAPDCGSGCSQSSTPIYWECPASGCSEIAESLAQQVQNPVALFSTDNNGVIIELPAASGPEASLSGSLIFGIGTQSNNGLNGATVYPVDPSGNLAGDFTTTFNNAAYNESFIDSGSAAFFFPDASIPVCSDDPYFYCPSSTENLSATNAGYNGTPTGTVNFSVANSDALPNLAVLGQLAGPNSIDAFDWGLPFFYGRHVYTAIDGQSTPGGTGPYWAY